VSERPGLRFGRVAEEYERVRPTYPATLVERACARAAVGPGDAVVEIGCGTGKLTRTLVERGLRVEAVEPDAELIAVACGIAPAESVRFHQARFEDVELPLAAFPAVFAATSFHWVDPAVGWHKVADLLQPDGVFALLSHVGGTHGELDDEVLRVWHDVVPDSAGRWRPVDDATLWGGVEKRIDDVSELWSWLTYHELQVPDAARLFQDVEVAREPFELTLTVEDYLAQIHTSNYYLHLAPEQQQRLDDGLTTAIEKHGGTYPARSFATLVTARRA
jgi:SAM-dependent methyltransferase